MSRQPPDNGLDFKAMAVAWKKAGKPCEFRAWCSSKKNQIFRRGALKKKGGK